VDKNAAEPVARNKKSIEVGQFFLPETVLNVHEKEFRIPKTMSDYKK